MKERIFEKMKEYGWNLGDNTNEEWQDVYNTHYNFIDSLYDYFVRTDEPNMSRNLNDINEQRLHDFADFMSDFLRALNDIENNTNTKLDLISHYIKNRGIFHEQIGQDVLTIINDNEESLENLKNRLECEIDYAERKGATCGYNKRDIQEIDCLNYELEKIKELL